MLQGEKKKISQTEPPNSFCVLSNLKSHGGPVTMLCVLHNQTYTEALCQDASFQMVPRETLVLGSILIRGIRPRNAPFSGIKNIEGICKLRVQNAGVYLYKNLTIGKEQS